MIRKSGNWFSEKIMRNERESGFARFNLNGSAADARAEYFDGAGRNAGAAIFLTGRYF
jgi:hypothetical protein